MSSTSLIRSMSSGEKLRYPDAVRAGWMSPRSSRKRSFDGDSSGKSSASRLSTWPMLNVGGAAGAVVRLCGSALTSAGGEASEVEARGVEGEPELADLHLGPVGEQRRLDADAVEEGAVQAAEVLDLEGGAVAEELRVPPRDGHVVEEDVGARVPADGRDVGVEQEPGTHVRAPAHHEEGRAGRQRVDRRLLLARPRAHRSELRPELVTERRGRLGSGVRVAAAPCGSRVALIDHRAPPHAMPG